MFIIVKLSDSETKARRKRRESPFFCQRTDIDFHRYFFTVTVKSKKGTYDKKALDRYAGRLCASMILPDTPYTENPKLSLCRLLNSAPDFLKRYSRKTPLKSICICDKKGFGTALAEALLPYTSSLHIISESKEHYTKTAERLFIEYGVSVTLSQKWNKGADSCELVITPSLEEIPQSFRGKIFTCDKKGTHPSAVYTARGTVLPYRFEKLRPPCTDKDIFALYLYEKCSLTEIESCPYESIDISRS